MSRVRRCDACGAIGDKPYRGWLQVSTHARKAKDDESLSGFDRIGTPPPLLTFDICGPGCLGELALARIDAFSEARSFEEETA